MPVGTSLSWLTASGETASLIRSFDWASTPLGPIDDWSPSFKIFTQLTLAQEHPSCLCVGAEGTHIYNDGYARMVGSKHPAALGHSIYDSFSEIEFRDIFTRVMAGEKVDVEDIYFPFKRHGIMEPAWFDASYLPARDENGEVFGVFCLVKETTARILAEKARDEQRAKQLFLIKLNDTIRPIVDPITLQRTAMQMLGEHLNVSRAFYFVAEQKNDDWIYTIEDSEYRAPGLPSIVGQHPRSAFGTGVFSGLHVGSALVIADVRNLAITPEQLQNYFSLNCMAAVGYPLLKENVLVGGVSVQNATPREWIKGEVDLIAEVAERTWAALERARAEKALRQTEKLAAVGRMASSIAHEINNPLEAVVNLIYLADNASISPDTARYLAEAQRELSRVSQIAAETLRFHRQSTASSNNDIVEVLESVLLLYQGRLRNAKIKIERRYAPHPLVTCLASEIRQVVANLIGNALDALQSSNRDRLVIVMVRSAVNPETGIPGVRLTISDTGSGIQESSRRHLFEPFFTTKTATGTGLGLWISADIVKKHKGRLHFRSSSTPRYQGTTFSLFLSNLT